MAASMADFQADCADSMAVAGSASKISPKDEDSGQSRCVADWASSMALRNVAMAWASRWAWFESTAYWAEVVACELSVRSR